MAEMKILQQFSENAKVCIFTQVCVSAVSNLRSATTPPDIILRPDTSASIGISWRGMPEQHTESDITW
jgi:hypothetical protein